jgi:Type I phosphodiesterase / nucleotide pyrophosphatase
LPATDRKAILIVIDGLTPAVLERAIEQRLTPTLARLAEHGAYRRAVSVFPSLTPVCMSSIVTGAYPDVHHIPHLVWCHRGERRVVEYGSSFGAVVAAGTRRSVLDTIFEMNAAHLAPEALTIFERLEDAGRVPAAVNVTCYRGRTRHRATIPTRRVALGPRRFFYYSLFESDETGAPLAVRSRAGGSIDAYAAAVGRWLVTRDGFDFLLYYLSDFDYASHARGPEGADDVLVRSDEAIAALVEAAGGFDEFLARYAVLVCSDHGQTAVSEVAHLEASFAGIPEVVVTASNRAGMVYRLPGCREEVRGLAERVDRAPGVEVAMFLEDGEAVARRESAELRFVPAVGGWRTSGDSRVLDHPDALQRVWAALRNPNAGDVLVSAGPGFEFADLGGRHHVGGGSHGSLAAGDSEVPVLTVGLDAAPGSITEIAPAILKHLGLVLSRAA